MIFPLDYWELHPPARGARSSSIRILMAALVAQESTFQADVQSSANAWGLMQILPATGRRYAQTLGIRPFSTRRLTDPETNVRIGTTYFADLLQQFGDVAPGAGRLQRRRAPRRRVAAPSGPASTATSSSTTSRSRRRRTT